TIVESGSLTELRHLTRTTVTAELDERPDSLAALPGVHDLHRVDGQVSFQIDGNRIDDAVRALASLGVRSLTAHPPTLEQLLLRHYGDALSTPGDDDGA